MSDLTPRASDLQPPTNNKTAGAVAGGGAGGLASLAVLFLLDHRYNINPGPEVASIIGSSVSTVVGGIITWWTPIITALQRRLLRNIDS